ncbi:MAG: energy transducer TonB [Bacteroidaceae bacterium]|nr:energy transducer TonB [Bacteroidaceae bacterium]
MTTEELDKRIGMPDIDAEWAKFEKDLRDERLELKDFTTTSINAKRSTQNQTFAKAAAITGIIFCLSLAGIASAVISSKSNLRFATIFAPDDDPIYDVVEKNPEYPGGMNGLLQFYIQNLHYPQIAQDCGVYGRVIVQFVVEKDGRCTNFKVLKETTSHTKLIKWKTPLTGEPKDRDAITQAEFEAAQKACTDEALRMCRRMERWTPGKIKDKEVRCRFTIPVTFKLK